MMRAAARATMKVPTTLTSRILRKRSTGVSSAWMSAAIPAELTTPSSPPSASADMATTFSAAASSVTSRAEVNTRLGAPSSRATSASSFSSRSARATFQPASSRRFAVASPMPDAPPVMSATRPFATLAIRIPPPLRVFPLPALRGEGAPLSRIRPGEHRLHLAADLDGVGGRIEGHVRPLAGAGPRRCRA